MTGAHPVTVAPLVNLVVTWGIRVSQTSFFTSRLDESYISKAAETRNFTGKFQKCLSICKMTPQPKSKSHLEWNEHSYAY